MRLALAALLVAVAPTVSHAADVAAVSKIDSVTVFLTGAEITRMAKVKLEKGEQTVVLSDIPVSAMPGSIRIEGKGTGKLDIGSVDTSRKILQRAESRAADAERKALEDQIEKLRDERATSEAEVLAAKTQNALIANLAQLPARQPPQQAQGATPALDDWPRILALISQATVEAGRSSLEAKQKQRDLDRRIADARARLVALPPATTQQTEVRVNVLAYSPLDADLTIHYQVPEAHWSPIYDARLDTGSKTSPPKLSLIRRAAITQRSGENWDGVELSLSTTRPADGAAAPELDTQIVDFEQEPRPVPAAADASPRMYKRSRLESSSDEAMGGVAPSPALAPPPEPVTEQVAQLESAPFEATFEVPGRTTVIGNGDAKRVLLMSEDIEPVLSGRTVPKLEEKAYLYANIKLAKGTPLLPGLVYLFRDGTYVGTGDLPLLPPGEDHDLGFGVDDQVKVKHAVLEEKRGETGLISTSHVDSRNYRVSIKNLHERPIDITVLDRVPVSQNDDIKVEVTGTAPTKKDMDDKRGVVAFNAKLEPDEEKIIEYGYRISWPASKSIVYGP